ncbi:MAG: hypothetical protein MUC50_06135 [Myxococcota bacterium]|jgi:hypothetical protein|nr:hypothetical protein [Myxococcota bacterium]
MRLLKLILTLLALLGAAYFVFSVPLGDGRTLSFHLGAIAQTRQARSLGHAVECSVTKAKDHIVTEVSRLPLLHPNDKKDHSNRPALKLKRSPVATPSPEAAAEYDRDALRNLIVDAKNAN